MFNLKNWRIRFFLKKNKHLRGLWNIRLKTPQRCFAVSFDTYVFTYVGTPRWIVSISKSINILKDHTTLIFLTIGGRALGFSDECSWYLISEDYCHLHRFAFCAGWVNCCPGDSEWIKGGSDKLPDQIPVKVWKDRNLWQWLLMRDWVCAIKRICGIKRDQPEWIIRCFAFIKLVSQFLDSVKVKLNMWCNKMSAQCRIVTVMALMCVYSCKFQTVFAPSCFPGKHLLSYYRDGANFANVWGSIYMTIYCHSWKAVRLCSYSVSPWDTGAISQLFQLHNKPGESTFREEFQWLFLIWSSAAVCCAVNDMFIAS